MPRKKKNLDQPALLEPETIQPIAINLDRLQEALIAPYLCIDIETCTQWSGIGPNSKDYGLSYCAEITVIAMAWNTAQGIQRIILANPVGEYPQEFCTALAERFKQGRTVIAHNAVFDMRGLSKLTGGITPESIWDTMVMERLLCPDPQRFYSLTACAAWHNISVPESMTAMKTLRNKLHTLPLEQVADYAGCDARVTLELYEKQHALVTSDNYELVEWECRAIEEYARIAARGIRLNTDYVKKYLLNLRAKQQQAEISLHADGLTEPSKRILTLHYIHITKRIPLPEWDSNTGPYNPRFTEGGRDRLITVSGGTDYSPQVELSDLSLSSAALTMIIGGLGEDSDSNESEESAWVDHTDSDTAQVLSDLITWKQCEYLCTVLSGLLDHAALDGRIHPLVTINTTTSRRSASHPQVQNWKMPQMGGVLLGDQDSTLVEIDYSNAENWAAAMLSGDSNFAKACSAEDFHSHMAAEYFGVLWNKADADKRKKLRFMGKRLTFGMAYGMGVKKLAASLGITLQEAQLIIRTTNATFAQVAQAKEAAQGKAASAGYINLWTRRKVPVHPKTLYTSWNYLAQGAVAEMIKRSIVLIMDRYRALGLASWVALDMHDAIVINVLHSEWDQVITIASEIMQGVIPDKYNTRTDPPIRWIAVPNMEENSKKWGLFQDHLPYSKKQV